MKPVLPRTALGTFIQRPGGTPQSIVNTAFAWGLVVGAAATALGIFLGLVLP